jgi:hypothetical protein
MKKIILTSLALASLFSVLMAAPSQEVINSGKDIKGWVVHFDGSANKKNKVVQQGTDGKQEEPAFDFPTKIAVSIQNGVMAELRFWSDGTSERYWRKNHYQFYYNRNGIDITSDVNASVVGGMPDFFRANPFTACDWINSSTLKETKNDKNGKFYYHELVIPPPPPPPPPPVLTREQIANGIIAEQPPAPIKQPASIKKAWIDCETLLPVRVEFDKMVLTFDFSTTTAVSFSDMPKDVAEWLKNLPSR